MTVNPFRKAWIHNGLRSGPDCNRFCEVIFTRTGYPSYLGRKSFNMSLFFVESIVADKHGEVAILDAHFLNSRVKECRNLFPDVKCGRSQDVAARNVVVLNEL